MLVATVNMAILPAVSLNTDAGPQMGDDVAVLLLTLAAENTELREQLAAAQDMLVDTATVAGQMHARVEALTVERDAWRAKAELASSRARLTG